MAMEPQNGRKRSYARQDESHGIEARLLHTLEQLLLLDATSLAETLNAAAQLVGEAVGAEKVDLFLHHPENHTLQVAGISATPMSQREVELGLDRIAIADHGRIAEVFETGVSFITGHADRDPVVMRGLTEGLGVRSMLVVPLAVGGERRGVLQAASSREDAFSAHDARFVEAVRTWVGLLVQRAELVERLTRSAAEQARRLAADELITLLAHDLGNLIAPISLRLQVLRRQAERKRRPRESSDLQAILAGVARLQGLIKNLLDTARLDQGLFTIEPETCDLTALIEAAVALRRTPSTPVHLDAEPHIVVQADPARLRQVIENLLENALLHAPPKTPVSISVEIERQARETEESGESGEEAESGESGEEAESGESAASNRPGQEWARVTVQNEGPGIPADLLPHLFERYARGQKSLGLGLGLYVSHQIARAHGGTLTADSTPGHGARFTLRLPLATDTPLV